MDESRKKVLPLNKKLQNKVLRVCKFNNAKLNVINGIIFNIENTNISYLEPHRFVITVKDTNIILLCYDNLNLYLLSKDLFVTIPDVKNLINELKTL